MKVGVSSYCFHRFFGDVYEGLQKSPEKKIDLREFIDICSNMRVDSVSIEENYLGSKASSYLGDIKRQLDAYGLHRTYSWGYPNGLEGGNNPEAYQAMIESIGNAVEIGADFLRVIGSSDMLVKNNKAQQIENLSEMLSRAAKIAENANINLSLANHSDFLPNELLQIVKNVNSPHFGINFVTGNFVRVQSDPVKGMQLLAPYVNAVDMKDLKPQKNVDKNIWHYFASVPLGSGITENRQIVKLLEENNFTGTIFVEIDYMHPEFDFEEIEVVDKSVAYLKRITRKRV